MLGPWNEARVTKGRQADMLNQEQIEKAAERLLDARESAAQAERLSETWPQITIEDAYAVSRAVAARRIKAGFPLIGHKVGLTSKAMQAASKIDQPDFGHVHSDNLFEDGDTLDFASFCLPRVEPELTFVLKAPLKGPGLGVIDVLEATNYVVPSIEVIDARVQEPRRIFDTIADNGAAAALVLGGRPVKPDAVDLRWVGGLLYRNAEIEETGVAAGVLGHPAAAVAWLANKLSEYGDQLEAGHVVLSGSFTRPVWAKKGDTIRADFGPLGSVGISFG